MRFLQKADVADTAVRQLNQTLDSLNRALAITGTHAVAPLNGLLVPEDE